MEENQVVENFHKLSTLEQEMQYAKWFTEIRECKSLRDGIEILKTVYHTGYHNGYSIGEYDSKNPWDL